MKTNILLLLALPLLLGCTAEDTPHKAESSQPRAVSFGVYTTKNITRADTAMLAEPIIPSDASIGVYGYYHDNGTWHVGAQPNFMFNQQATNSGGMDYYRYAPLKYWPNEDADCVSFMAYYPYVNTSGTAHGLTPQLTNASTGLPTFLFTVDDNVKRQVDFLLSDLQANQTRNTPVVRFVMKHATSKIEFRVVVDDAIRRDLAYFTLHDISLKKLYKEGTYTPAYDVASGQTTLTCTPKGVKKERYACKTTEAYLLLPQQLDNEARLSITYDLAFKSEGTTYIYDDSGNSVATDVYAYVNRTNEVQLNTLTLSENGTSVTEWLPGHHYIYIIRLGARRIDFTAQVVGWGEYIWQTITPSET